MQSLRDKDAKTQRILEMYTRLCEGKLLRKEEEAQRYLVDGRTIQRDIDDIRSSLSNRRGEGDSREIVYDRLQKAFLMRDNSPSTMSNGELLAVSKILLESRAFTRKQMNILLDKLVSGCVPQQNRKVVTDLLANERHHYISLKHHSDLPDKLWTIGLAVKDSLLMKMTYRRQGSGNSTVTHYVEPVAIMFSEFYFYLIAYQVEVDQSMQIVAQKHEYPAIFRVDRIREYTVLNRHFTIPYRKRFEDGAFRKRVQFMYPGKLMTVELRYTGKSVEAILDRLSTAEITRQDGDVYYIKAEVYGKGILMWLMSQGAFIEVLSPQSLRQQMQEHLQNTLTLYEK